MEHHNALSQATVRCDSLTLQGFSISGLATYVQVPELDACFDMGECPISALSLNHVFLTHAHGDHARCLPRHWQLRRMLGNERSAAYFVPDFLKEGLEGWIAAEARFEGVPEDALLQPWIVPIAGDLQPIALPYRKDLRVRAFPVNHRARSLGYTILSHRKKLKAAYHGVPGHQLAELRAKGVDIQDDVDEPLVTFIGDCDGATLLEQAHIWDSPVLVLEATFLEPGEEPLAAAKSHTHIAEISHAVRRFRDRMKVRHLVLKHFSMRYERSRIHELVEAAFPHDVREWVRVLL